MDFFKGMVYNSSIKKEEYVMRYKNNQITDVVFQIRYSTILKINNDSDTLLSEFQNKIKKEYPNYQVLNENIVNVEMKGEINNIDNVTPQIMRNNLKNHIFISTNGKTKINLTPNFISLSTQEYKCWEDFKDKFLKILDEFVNLYDIENFNRIGIRYINAFSKKELGINNEEKWDKYLSNEVLGLTSKYNVNVYSSNIEIPFEDYSQMRMICGLGTKQNEMQPIPVFIIDKDTYKIGNLKLCDISQILEKLHKHNSEVFESLIKDPLRDKMGVI